jgi:peroxiredoxin
MSMRRTTTVLALGLLAGMASFARAAAVVGQAAAAFTLTDVQGKSHSLDALKGKWVVLEWVNYDCPFVQKHYKSGNMQALQTEYTGKGVVWLSVNSSAPGKQGNFTAAEIEAKGKERKIAYSAYLLDTDGKVGRAYDAKTTPHMYVIDPAGKLVYAGGIDDKPSTDLADVKTATNYVRAALDAAMAGKPVAVTSSQPYGCSVKY